MKETKELMVGLLKLSALLAVAFKDGVQATDIVDIFAKIQGDTVLKQALMDAYNGADQVGTELKTLNAANGIELILAAIPEVKALIDAIAAPKA